MICGALVLVHLMDEVLILVYSVQIRPSVIARCFYFASLDMVKESEGMR